MTWSQNASWKDSSRVWIFPFVRVNLFREAFRDHLCKTAHSVTPRPSYSPSWLPFLRSIYHNFPSYVFHLFKFYKVCFSPLEAITGLFTFFCLLLYVQHLENDLAHSIAQQIPHRWSFLRKSRKGARREICLPRIRFQCRIGTKYLKKWRDLKVLGDIITF